MSNNEFYSNGDGAYESIINEMVMYPSPIPAPDDIRIADVFANPSNYSTSLFMCSLLKISRVA